MQQTTFVVMSNRAEEGVRIQFELKAWSLRDALLKINLHPFTFPDDFLPAVAEENPQIDLEPEWCSKFCEEIKAYDNIYDYFSDKEHTLDAEIRKHLGDAVRTVQQFYGVLPSMEGNYLSENNTQWIILEVTPYGNVIYHGLEVDKKCLK